MLPEYLRSQAKIISKRCGNIKLAIFGPGKGSPFFEKRTQAFKIIQNEHKDAAIDFYLIDDLELPAKDFDDYLERVYPAEMKQVEWADIIIFLLTHHKLTAFVEYGFLQHSPLRTGNRFDKCAVAIGKDVEVPPMWTFEAQRQFKKSPKRIIVFSKDDLESCRVASDLTLELFELTLIQRFGGDFPRI